MEPTRIAFSIPIVYVHSHPLVCGPVMASHPLDLQSFPNDSEPHVTITHVGPPAPNVEVKLAGVLDTSVEKGGDPTGDVCFLFLHVFSITQLCDIDFGARTFSFNAPSSPREHRFR